MDATLWNAGSQEFTRLCFWEVFKAILTMEQGIVVFASSPLYSLDPKPQTLKSSEKIQKGKFLIIWVALLGNTLYVEQIAFHISQRAFVPLLFLPRLQTSRKCISVKWSHLHPIKPSVLPLLCMPLAFSLLYLDCPTVYMVMLYCMLFSRK